MEFKMNCWIIFVLPLCSCFDLQKESEFEVRRSRVRRYTNSDVQLKLREFESKVEEIVRQSISCLEEVADKSSELKSKIDTLGIKSNEDIFSKIDSNLKSFVSRIEISLQSKTQTVVSSSEVNNSLSNIDLKVEELTEVQNKTNKSLLTINSNLIDMKSQIKNFPGRSDQEDSLLSQINEQLVNVRKHVENIQEPCSPGLCRKINNFENKIKNMRHPLVAQVVSGNIKSKLFLVANNSDYETTVFLCEEEGGKIFIPKSGHDNDVWCDFAHDVLAIEHDSSYYAYYPKLLKFESKTFIWADGKEYPNNYDIPLRESELNSTDKVQNGDLCFVYRVQFYASPCKNESRGFAICERVNLKRSSI